MTELFAMLKKAWVWGWSKEPLPRVVRLCTALAGIVAVVLAVWPDPPPPPDEADVRLTATRTAFGFFRAIRVNAINVGGTPILFEREATLRVDGSDYTVRLFAQGDGQDQILSPRETAVIGLADSEDAARALPELSQFECELEYGLRAVEGGEAETHRFCFSCETLGRPD